MDIRSQTVGFGLVWVGLGCFVLFCFISLFHLVFHSPHPPLSSLLLCGGVRHVNGQAAARAGDGAVLHTNIGGDTLLGLTSQRTTSIAMYYPQSGVEEREPENGNTLCG